MEFEDSDTMMRIGTSTTPMELEPVIDYGKPLMNCLETLVQNERFSVRMPASKHKTISVPLLAYCSSTERGTIFAPDEPKYTFEMPFVPFFEKSQEELKTKTLSSNQSKINTELKKNVCVKPPTTGRHTDNTKLYRNAKPMIHSNRLIDFDVSLVTNKKEYNSTDSVNKASSKYVITQSTKYKGRRHVSIGHNTIITGHPKQNTLNRITKPDISPIAVSHWSKPIRQYTNKKAKALQHAQNNNNANSPLVPTTGTSEPKYDTDPMLATIARLSIKNANDKLNPNTGITNPKFPTTFDDPILSSNEAEDENILTKDVYDTEATFMPYTHYSVSATDSKNVQSDEVSSNYYGPLDDFTGTIYEDYLNY